MEYDYIDVTAFGDTHTRYAVIAVRSDRSSFVDEYDFPLVKTHRHWLDEGYTELFEQDGQLWGFPPNAVMPVPLERI